MKRIICLSVLVFLLCTSIASTKSRFEAGLFFGSYQPSFSTINHMFRFRTFKLKGENTQGCSFAYQTAPTSKIRVQLEYFEAEALPPYLDIRLKTIAISVLGLRDLVQFENYKVYGGIGLIDYHVSSQVKNWLPWFGNPPASEHNFGFPSGAVVLLGLATSTNKPFQFKGEIQYVAGTDEELFDIPLDWDGFKFLLGIGIKF